MALFFIVVMVDYVHVPVVKTVAFVTLVVSVAGGSVVGIAAQHAAE